MIKCPECGNSKSVHIDDVPNYGYYDSSFQWQPNVKSCGRGHKLYECSNPACGCLFTSRGKYCDRNDKFSHDPIPLTINETFNTLEEGFMMQSDSYYGEMPIREYIEE